MRHVVPLALLALALLPPLGLSAAPNGQDWFPAHKGARWTYTVTGGPRTQAIIEILGNNTAKWNQASARLQITTDGIVVLVTRHVGIAGLPKDVPMVDLRWSGASTWKTHTMEGCIMYDIEGSRTGTDRIATPAGTYDTVKIVNKIMDGTDTYWVAKGIGIVQRIKSSRNQEERWTLTKASIP